MPITGEVPGNQRLWGYLRCAGQSATLYHSEIARVIGQTGNHYYENLVYIAYFPPFFVLLAHSDAHFVVVVAIFSLFLSAPIDIPGRKK